MVHLHGLEANSDSGHMKAMSLLAHDSGFASLRLDWRGCGASEVTCKSMYHALAGDDLAAAVGWASRRLPGVPIFLTGISLGGAVALRWLSSLGPLGPALVRGLVTISAPLDLDAAARQLAKPANRPYERWFLASMKARVRRAARRSPETWGGKLPAALSARCLRAFDDVVTAPMAGQSDASAYYENASAGRSLGELRVPTILIHAKDDPFVPPPTETGPFGRLMLLPAGGHGGFLAGRPMAFAGGLTTDRWAEGAAISLLADWL